jgi:hypothetical protein
MKKVKNHQLSMMKAACAGLIASARGKARTFADKRTLLPGIIAADMDDEIAEGMSEYLEKKAAQTN